MSRRKPRGLNAALKIKGAGQPELVPNVLPDEKAAIEARILDLTLKANEAQEVQLYELEGLPVQNPENDYDFTLPTTSGIEYLDLVEVVLKGGYQGAPTSIAIGNMVDQMFALVKRKARKYGMRRRSIIHLLMYSTHWKFLPSESVIALLSLYCHRKQHGFKTVAVMMPIMDDASVLWRCFPSMKPIADLSRQEELRLRARVLHQLGPADAKPTPEGGGVHWTIPR